MKLIVCFFLFSVLATMLNTAQCQDMLLVEKPGTVENVKFFEGSFIELREDRDTTILKIRGTITGIFDSSIIINGDTEVLVSRILTVYQDRRLWKVAGFVSLVSGSGYFVLDSFNRLINNERPVSQKSTLKTSSYIIGAGLLTFPFHKKRFRIGKKWRIKVLIDNSVFKN